MARVVSSSSSSFFPVVFRRQHEYSKNQRVYGNETWHTDRVLKRDVHRHINITKANKSSATAELARDAENVDFSVDDVHKT